MRLLLLPLLYLFIGSCASHQLPIKADLQSYIEDSIADFKVHLKRASHGRQRIRREFTLDDFKQALPQAFESQVDTITPWNVVPSLHTVELEPFLLNNDTYFASVNFKNKNNEYNAYSYIYKMQDGNLTEIQKFATSGGIDFEYVEMGFEKYAIFLDYAGNNFFGRPTYERWFQINQFLPYENEFKPFQFKTKVRALGATKVKVFEKNDVFFFLTANSYNEAGNQYHVKSTMHVKVPFGFQVVQEFETMGATDVETMVIDGLRYVLFMNHQDNRGSVDIYSFVYKEKRMHEITSKDNYAPFGLYQRLLTHGGRDFEYFTFLDNHYLIAVNEFTQLRTLDANIGHPVPVRDYNVDSIIYWWTGTLWVEWQRIPTYGAMHAKFFLSEFGDPMFVISNSRAQATIFTFDPLRGLFKPTNVQGLYPYPDRTDYIPDVRSVHAFRMDNQTFLSVANYNATDGYNIFKLTFKKSPVSKLDPTIPEIVMQLIANMKKELEMIKNTLTYMLLRVTDNVLTKSTNQNVRDMKITETVIKQIKSSNVHYTRSFEINPVYDMANQTANIRAAIEAQKKILEQLKSRMESVVFTDEVGYVHGRKTFSEVDALDTMIKNGNITGLLDGIDIIDFNQNVFRTDIPQEVTGTYTFTNTATFRQDINITGKLNNISVDSFLTTSTPQTISAEKSFQSDLSFTSDINLNAFCINNVTLSNLLTKATTQTLTQIPEYQSVDFIDVMLDFIGTTDVENYHTNKVSLTGADTFNNTVTFAKGFEIRSDFNVTGTVDGVNLETFVSDVETASEEQVITDEKFFKTIKVLGTVTVEKINDHNIDNAAKVNQTNVFTAPVVFDSVVFKEQFNTSSTVNGLNFPQDVVLTNSNHIIHGNKTFRTIYINENLVVDKLNGYDPDQFYDNFVLKNQRQPVTGVKKFIGGAVLNELRADIVNGISMSNLSTGLFFLNATTWSGNFRFQNIKVQGNLVVLGKLNGYRIPDDLVLLHENQFITGEKTFVNRVSLQNVIFSSLSRLNNHSLLELLETSVRKSIHQQIQGNINFEKSVTFNKNIEAVTINSRPASTIGTTTTEQNFTGNFTFVTDLLFESEFLAKLIIVETTVNDIDISEMERNAVYKNSNQTINGSIIFVSGIDCKQNLSVAGLINGINITELSLSAVRISRDQHIENTQIFASDTHHEREIVTSGYINNFNITELAQETLKKDETKPILKEMLFGKDVRVTENINISGHINNIDIENFLSKAVNLNDAPVTVNGTLYYNELHTDHVNAELFNGIEIDNLLTIYGDQTIPGSVDFKNITADSFQTKLINELNITSIAERSLKIFTPQDVAGKYTFKNDVEVKNEFSVKEINGVDVEEFLKNALNLYTEQTVTEIDYFEQVTIENAYTGAFINNVNITNLLNDALLSNGTQTVCYRKNYENVAMSSGKISNIINNHFINDINITDLHIASINIKAAETISGHHHYENLVVESLYANLVNNFNLDADFMTTYTNQTIETTFYAHDVVVKNSLNASLIDGVDINSLYNDRIHYGEDVIINSTFDFVSLKTEKINMPSNATINGISPSSLVSVSNNSFFEGYAMFKDLVVKTAQANTVNGVDLSAYVARTLYENRSVQTFVADQEILETLLILGNLSVDGLVNGQIINTEQYPADISNKIQSRLEMLNSTANILCPKLTTLLSVTTISSDLIGVEKVAVVDLPSTTLGGFDSTVINDVHYISIARAENAGCGAAYIIECFLFPICSVLQTIYTNSPTLEFFTHNDQPALMINHDQHEVNKTTSFTCPVNPEIYIWSSVNHIFEPFQTVNVDVIGTSNATVIKSSTLTSKYRESSGKKKLDVKFFKSKVQKNKEVDYMVSTGNDTESDYVDVFEINGNGTVGSLKKKQRLVINSKRQNKLSMGSLNKKPVLAVSSSRGYDMKLFVFNDDKKEFQFYQNIKQSATSVRVEQVKKNQFLLFASPEQGFGLCSWLGVSGFQDCQSSTETETLHVETILTTTGAYTIMGKIDRLIIYRMIFDGISSNFTGSVC